MTVQFVLGRAGTGKTQTILNQIKSRLTQSALGSPMILLVPEQASFQAEYTLATIPGLGGVIGTQVLSFGRLAHRLLQEMGDLTLVPVDELGKQMVLRLMLERYREELQVFKRAASQPGFTAQLGRLISECKSYGVSFTHTENVDWGSGTLNQKIHDLRLIMNAYEAHLAQGYWDADDILNRIAVMVKDSAYIAQAEVYIDGFSGFTNQELRVIEQLMIHAKQVTIALCLDPAERNDSPDELGLFHPTLRTYQNLEKMAKEAGVEVRLPILLTEGRRFASSPWLRQLEQQYFAWGDPGMPPASGRTDEVSLLSAANRRAEVEAVALQILELARKEGYRWGEMAILLRELGTYADELSTVFTDYGIPFFLDQKRSVMHHPLMELIRSALEVVVGKWRYEAVFRCLKTDLITPVERDEQSGESERGLLKRVRRDIDLLENYVLAHGVFGSYWMDDKPWRFGGEQKAAEDQAIDVMRKIYSAPLLQLQLELSQAESKDVRSLTTALYRFLVHLDVPGKLEKWQQKAEGSGELEDAQMHGQVWNGLMKLFDQIVEVMGEEQMDLTTFAGVLDSGLESIELGLVPPALDQVLVGSMERSRQPDVRALFLLGVNEGVIPLRPKEDGVLDEAERERLAELGLELAPTAKQRLMAEPFLLYQAMSRPSERLYLSCALADEEGKALLPSSVFTRVREVLPDASYRFFYNEPSGNAEEDLFLLGTPRRVFRHLLTLVREMKQSGNLPVFWWEVYDWFLRHSPSSGREAWLLSGLRYTNRPSLLDKNTSQALYGTELKMSVSRLERFQTCPFSHFSSHGLRLKERQLYKLERFDVGELFHASLKRAVEKMNEDNLEWGRLTEENSMQLARDVVDELVPATRSSILTRTARYRYLAGKLKRAVGRAIYVLGEHAKRSRFAPVGLEIAFGPGGELPGLDLRLTNGVHVQLIGRIDRVDQSLDGEVPYLRVIDYKSSPKQLVLSDVFNGLNLQLLVYLDVVVTHAEEWLGKKAEMAGVFYYQVADPFVTAKRLLSSEEAAKERAKKLRMKGLMLADPELARMMDAQVEQGASELLPFELKKDGSLSSRSSVATADQFQALQGFVRDTVKELSTRMTDGDIQISPYVSGTLTACERCAYQAVCQFDPEGDANSLRQLPKWNSKEVWGKIENGSCQTGGGMSDGGASTATTTSAEQA
ncbi:helicase-exonuclease AddAB subunit AddB [Brevibacillus ruminantium]|uniref:ATP-dependent helicase/deoxyribonuclease subunit B n=1 Tax=Brevibacillus ruminantium TaxID=2950604 RepID=A0ABY4WJT7_9BACL|nr:helicase-exonuclease AddAB subunit AddB [Brevibacillus ruminantium]USG64916.1 helicase-exonuclease AddAB subunit AddB [Brevibacillus ruminantium]